MKFAWIENGKIRDVCPGDPASSYTPNIAVHYAAQVPDTAAIGDSWDGMTLTKAPIVQPAPLVAGRIVTPVEFKLLFTPQERIAIKTSTDTVVLDWYSIIEDPRLTGVDLNSAQTKAALDYLVSKTLLTAARAAQILAP